jgi:5-methyltetrahydrofolate--homocysteine methyltransferase
MLSVNTIKTPEEMQALIKEYLQDNLINIIGGCCGTTRTYQQSQK